MAAGDVSVRISRTRGFACNLFDGVDDYIEIAHTGFELGTNYTAEGMTVSAWILPFSMGEGDLGMIIGKVNGTSAENGWKFRLDTAGALACRINAGTVIKSANGSIIGSGETWYHVLMTIATNATVSFYINGVISGTPAATNALTDITTTNAIRIGNRSTATDQTFKGGIREVKMWKKVLSAAEIANDYAGIKQPDKLQHYWHLGGRYTDGGTIGETAVNSGSVSTIEDDTLAAAAASIRVGSGDKWMLFQGEGGDIGVINING